LRLYVSELEIQTNILMVRPVSDKNKICIRVNQSPIKDCFLIWDLAKDIEIDSFDIDKSTLPFQDYQGNVFLAEKDYVINCESGCKIKSYNLNVSDFDTESMSFQFQKGHRVEDGAQNWIIFRNFINLSFSYMTFVIKDNFDKCGYIMDDYLFDIEGYNYILNKNTIFAEGTLVT
jgi:hypothetical protein